MNIFIENPTAEQVKLIVFGKEYTLTEKELDAIRVAMSQRADHLGYLSFYKMYYNGYGIAKIKEELENQDVEEGGDYRINEDMGLFIVVEDNNEAQIVIKAEYDKAFPNNTIEYDSESGQFNAYTKSYDEAVSYSMWLYTKYIKPSIDSWKFA